MTTRGRESGEPYVLIYDGACGFCRAVVDAVRRRDRAGRIRPVPLQDEAAVRHIGVSPESAREAIVLAAPDGRRWSDGDAVARLLGLLPRGRAVAWLLELPGIRGAVRAGYRWTAWHRGFVSRVTGLDAPALDPAEARPPAEGRPRSSVPERSTRAGHAR